MAYCTNADIAERLAKFTIDATTTPNTTQVGDIADQVAAEIDTVLSAQGVTLPISGSTALTVFLEGLNADGAAAITLASMFPDRAGTAEASAINFYNQRYKDGLARLVDGSAIPDTVIGTTSGYLAPSTYLLNYPDEDSQVDLGTEGEPFFTRSKVF